MQWVLFSQYLLLSYNSVCSFHNIITYKNSFYSHRKIFNSLADLRGGARVALRWGPNSFIFMQFSAKNLQHNPNLGIAPPPWKILDPPLKLLDVIVFQECRKRQIPQHYECCTKNRRKIKTAISRSIIFIIQSNILKIGYMRYLSSKEDK